MTLSIVPRPVGAFITGSSLRRRARLEVERTMEKFELGTLDLSGIARGECQWWFNANPEPVTFSHRAAYFE